MMHASEVIEARALICVLGMHRSGTSLVMRLVNLLGVEIGPKEQLIPAASDNPRGFWEHREIVRLNQVLLRRLGGTCLRPPTLEPGWEVDPRLDDLRAHARRLVTADFGATPAWGWKDPRSSITLPLWRTVVEPTHYVLCVRHPRDVVRSLQRRDGRSLAGALRVWLLYTRSALRATGGENRICVAYERVIDDGSTEINRLASFLGLPARALAAEVCETARTLVDPTLQHHRTRGAPSDTVCDAVAAALRLAYGAYEELAWRDVPRDDDADRLVGDALALVTPTVEQEESLAAASWGARRRQGLEEITAAVPPGESFILVDAMRWATEEWVDGRRRIPFLEHEGKYWGLPPDDETAIRELQRLRGGGAAFVAFAEPAFQWLDFYPGMKAWLQQTFLSVIQTDRAIVFDLRAVADIVDERTRTVL